MSNLMYYETILTLTKSLNTLLLTGVIESSNSGVRNALEFCLKESLKDQYNLFEQMKSDSYYNISNVKNSDILKLITKLKKDDE